MCGEDEVGSRGCQGDGGVGGEGLIGDGAGVGGEGESSEGVEAGCGCGGEAEVLVLDHFCAGEEGCEGDVGWEVPGVDDGE